jgi:hypothetical protein
MKKRVKALLLRYWTWYNNLNEPWRMLMMLLMCLPLFASTIVSEFVEMPYRPFVMIGCVLVPFGLICTRWWAHSKDNP